MSRRHVRLASFALLALALPALAADSYTIDPEHASVMFKVKHLGVSYTWGRFNDVKGSFVLDEANPAASRIEVVIKTESVDSGNERRDRHLRNADFFDAAQFPEIRFVSKTVSRAEPNQFTVTGDLTLHGVTRPLTVTVNKVGAGADPWGGQRAGGELTFTVKRSDFGMSYGLPNVVGDEVTLFVSLEGIKQ
jgi:polyisoprenoid-binding protein YceI